MILLGLALIDCRLFLALFAVSTGWISNIGFDGAFQYAPYLGTFATDVWRWSIFLETQFWVEI
jgi:hypothetical protein